ncbi:MAG: phospho-N-acetylmuramoyl-pentapeptide-transferase [Candidatus Marinimicrobia bacterium]|nr:phospho-N-acetylmuramoyl-pentapeptide-transferase [Candidatus Neomarinimicrobiota bacterium]MDD5709421.1 phospho-N-acetylmuramoyl-pentapeptide-transferase [Candidatus Neomarinimicrobiota bacterium]MDX9777695.1 phospho-N-acetylmuramoyl-pentapeptide-transferase [bacterium]
MLYKILYPLKEYVSWLNLMGYISFRSAGAAITALLITFFLGPVIIRALRRHHIGETIRSDGPESHKIKAGTPTMGGLIIHLAVVVPVLLWADISNRYVLMTLFVTVWMAIIGYIDDYLKVVKKMKRGLVARYKLLGQIIIGLIVALFMYLYPSDPALITATSVPFFKNVFLNFGIFYTPFVILYITGFSNAVNLTDGLDGLASGLMALAAFSLLGISYISGRVDFSQYLGIMYLPTTGELTVFLSAMLGGLVGFLWFNSRPAEVFMGDTGSLAYGAALGTVAILLKKEIVFLMIGFVFVLEALSVVLQVGWFRHTKRRFGEGRRLFRMAPLHHHFEELGWPESKVVIRFWILGIFCALMSLATFKIL